MAARFFSRGWGAPGWLALVVLVLSYPALCAAAAAPDPGLRCTLGAYVNVVGFDTRSGEALFSFPGATDGTYLVAWTLGKERASLTRESEENARFGGSVGPGAPFAFRRCGDSCLQPLRFAGGGWEPLGEPLTVPMAATAHGTYDRSGTPWVVVHGPAEREGFVTAWAFHAEGREWRPRGSLEVAATGDPGALPAPWFAAAIVSGTGLFPAEGEPRSWAAGLPAGGLASGSRLVPFDRRAAAFLSSEEAIYRSEDAGAAWSLSTWTPWATGTAEPWERGEDYGVDLPVGAPTGAFPVLWYDRRLAGRERLIFTEMAASGRWRVLATGPARLPTSTQEELAVGTVLRTDGGDWAAVFGCVKSGGAPRLVVVELRGGKLGAPKLVPITRR